MQVTVNVPDSLYRHILRLAQASGRSAADVIESMMSVSLLPLSGKAAQMPLEKLTDEAVRELAQSQMNPVQSERLSELLEKQQAGQLSETEEAEKELLLYIYQEGSLLKAQALVEARRRGLVEMA
jgi:predicted transcriptional regulator